MGALVTIATLTFSIAKYALGQVEITGAMSSFFMPGIIRAYHVYWRTWIPFVGERLQ